MNYKISNYSSVWQDKSVSKTVLQDKLDDSGFSEAPDENVMFYFKLNSLVHRMVFARQQDTLAYMLTQTYPTKKVQNFLVWARIRGPVTELRCVNPLLMTCGFIKPETDVELEEIREAINEHQKPQKLPDIKPLSTLQPGMQNTLFFISISNREKMERITNVHYTNLRYRDMCVVARLGQSYKAAIESDGRFVNVDRFTLKRKLEGGEGSAIDMDLKPGDIKEEMTFLVKVKKAVQSSGKSSTALSSSTCQSALGDVETEELTVARASQKKENFNTLGQKLWKENSIYVFSKDPSELTKKELLAEMVKCLKARGWSTLVGPKGRGPKKYETSLQQLVKHEFANQNIASRPVRVTKRLMKLYDSVGLLECGSVKATCFLVSGNMIATNWHVVRDILEARNTSTSQDHRNVDIRFNFEEAGAPENRRYRLKDISFQDNIICTQLDYAFLYLQEFVLEVLPLGDFVTCKVPERGTVCIAAHPSGNEKQEEVCPILPLHEDRRTHDLKRRYEEYEWHCRNNQSGCALSYARQYAGKCVHSYQTELQELCTEEKALTYDVGSMFEGSSGAPVFDLKCNIVALHTAGFRLGETSVVECGVTFEAIICHLKATGHSEFVREHFQNCNDEDTGFIDTEVMDTN